MHPFVGAAFFATVAVITMVCRNPIMIIISLIFAFINSVIEGGTKALKFNLIYLLPVMLLTALINPLFNHRGVTVLWKFPGGNALTAESIIYGLCSGMMLGAIVAWFTYHNKVMTSDKICYIFGRIIPSLSLIFSMTLRFVPLMGNRLKRIIVSRKCLLALPDKAFECEKAGKRGKLREGLKITSVFVDRGLETAITTSESMRSRGYGSGKRSFFSVFRLNRRDVMVLLVVAVLAVYVAVGAINGCLAFEYYPAISQADLTAYSLSIIIAYAVLCALPLFLRKYEDYN